jgi:hypothetical protein
MRFALGTTDYARDAQVIRDNFVATLKHHFESIDDEQIEAAWQKRVVQSDADGVMSVHVAWPI